MVEYFKEALKGEGKVHAGNSSPISPAFYYADESVVTPLIYDDNYIPFILEYCINNDIVAVVSLFDVDLLILSQNKKLFEEHGIKIIVSDEEVINICNDKWKTYEFCMENGINAAKTYNTLDQAKQALELKELDFPLIVKPRWGMGSLAIYQADNNEELEVFYNKTKKNIYDSYLKYEAEMDIDKCVIIQEKIIGQEYGIDVINDLDKNFCNTIVRKKYAMRSGETDCAIVVKDEAIESFGVKLSSLMKHTGNMDADLFVNDNGIYLLEMNARFGGGYPFSHMAGVNVVEAIVKWLKGDVVSDELKVKEYDRIVQKDIRLIDITNNR